MLFESQELREVLARTWSPIELRNKYGRCYRTVSCEEALALNLDLFIGIGNRRRIRFLRRRVQRFQLNAGSRTTERMKGESQVNIAPPFIRQHRRIG